MTDKMPDEIYAVDEDALENHRKWMVSAKHSNYVRKDIHEKAVKERDALKAENERLRGGLEELRDGYLPELWVNIEGRKPDIEDMDFIFDFIDKALQGRKETK